MRGEPKLKVRLNLNTMTDIQKFVDVTSKVTEPVILRDSAGHCVSAKSLLGALYSLEWAEIYCECEKDITCSILSWVI